VPFPVPVKVPAPFERFNVHAPVAVTFMDNVALCPKHIVVVPVIVEAGRGFTVNAAVGLEVIAQIPVPVTTTSNVAPFSVTGGLLIVKVVVVTLL
jgi:hypothetical protein